MAASDKIIERVRQLLAMSRDASSPHEAAIAAGRARKLMDQHQISLDDLKDNGGFGYRPAGEEYRFMPIWQSVLSVGVAELNDCKVIKSHKWQSSNSSYSYQLLFQGYENDAICAAAMYDYLVDTVKRLCANYIRELGYTKYPAKIGDPYKRGAASELQRRLKAITKEREEDVLLRLTHQPGTSLVLFKRAAVEEHFGKAEYRDTKTVKVRSDAVLDAIHRGKLDASKIEIQRKLKEDESGERGNLLLG